MTERCSGPEATNNARGAVFPLSFRNKKAIKTKSEPQNLAKT